MNTPKAKVAATIAILEPIRKEAGELVYRLTLPSKKTMERRVPKTPQGFSEVNKWAAQFGRFRHN